MESSRTLFGFWVFLMTDCILFSMLFATYAVLHQPMTMDLSIPLLETLILLTSSFTVGIAMLPGKSQKHLYAWFALTFLLGLAFVVIEGWEFAHLGHNWTQHASFSAFFVLVGTHGLHVSLGLIWMVVLLALSVRQGVSHMRLTCLRLYWHFLDVVWIFIFTFVYLIGAQ